MSEDKRFCEMINDKEWIDYKFEYKNNQKVMKELYKQLDLYKSVIDEVREYIYNHELVHERVYVLKGEDVLKILDKAKVKNENK